MYKKILVAVDVAHESSWRKSIPLAVELATQFQAGLIITTVVRDMDAGMVSLYPPAYQWVHEQTQEKLREIVKKCVPETLHPIVLVGEGSISREVIRLAKEQQADLIVMASHRPEMKDYLIGPNASAVVRHATCSVLVVRE